MVQICMIVTSVTGIVAVSLWSAVDVNERVCAGMAMIVWRAGGYIECVTIVAECELQLCTVTVGCSCVSTGVDHFGVVRVGCDR